MPLASHGDRAHVYHLPSGKSWDVKVLLKALQERGVDARRDGERIFMTLPVERMDIDQILKARTLQELEPERIGYASATISYAPEAVLGNIVFETSRSFDADAFPRVTDVTQAILDCGYDSGSEQEIANKYYKGAVNIDAIFGKIEELQIGIEQAIAEQRFEDAAAILVKQRPFKQQIDDLLRDSIRED